MIKYKMQDIVVELIKQNKNILFLDTCCLLDIIRCIQREKVSVLESAINIIDNFDKKQNQFNIVLPSLVMTEWLSNYESVKKDTKSYIEKLDLSSDNIFRFINLIYDKKMNNSRFSKYNLETVLCDFSKKILNSSLGSVGNEECNLKALERVVKEIPPATKGKESTKDCVIFEEILYLSNLLRDSGFNKKIVFASSNIKEYFVGSCLTSNIEEDTKKYNIRIVTTLNHGYYEVQEST